MNKGQDLTKLDFALAPIDFSEELYRMREQFAQEVLSAIKPRGWLNKMFYKLAKQPFYI